MVAKRLATLAIKPEYLLICSLHRPLFEIIVPSFSDVYTKYSILKTKQCLHLLIIQIIFNYLST